VGAGPITKVLVIDDEPDLRKLIQFSLQAVGKWQVVLGERGEDAVPLALRERPDVILLDVQLPGLDGPQTLQALRAEPPLAKVPVLFITATAPPEERARLLSLGAAGVITKPFDPFGLPREIARLVADALE
jgi:two-component system, OmpR family, response regulator